MLDNNPQLDPGSILHTAFAFWSSKVLLTAVEFGLFTIVGNRRITGEALGAELGLHQRGISDFFDALVAMQFLGREGDGPSAKYHNTAVSALYLDSNSPRYIGGILVMLNARLFKFWNDLPEPSALANRKTKPSTARREYSKSSIKSPPNSNSLWAR
jgi:Dimerisation domain